MNLNTLNNAIGVMPRWLQQTLLVMKITTLILLTGLLQVSASSIAQHITLKQQNVKLTTVFNEIKKQTGYIVLYQSDQVNDKKEINVNLKNATLELALERVLNGQNLTYLIKDKSIILKEKEPSFLDRIFNDHFEVKGVVVDDKGSPLPGATIRVKGTNIVSQADRDGNFNLGILDERNVLVCSFVGYETIEVKVSKESMRIVLVPASQVLSEVGVVSTGYQKLPKERATGSFELVDNQLFNRSVGTNVFSRLNGITNLNFTGFTLPNRANHRFNPAAYITIRGASSFLPKSPLIVVDNFPYDGDLNNINPNDIADISILKDAAATSIWGTKAANGVIVITTKKGGLNQSPLISLSSNVTIAQKPDLFYQPQISSSDYIDFETFLFNKGRYNGAINDKYAYVSPVVDLLTRQRNDPSNPVYQQQIDALRGNDLRKDLLKYVYRNAVNQQYAVNVSGGNNVMTYYLSGGYDKNLESQVTDGYERMNLRFNTSININKKLNLETALQYTQNKYKDLPTESPTPLDYYAPQPYVRLADDQGNPLAVYPLGIKKAYTDTAGGGRLLDWSYKPLAELDQSTKILNNQDVLLNVGLTYKLNSILSATVKYQYEKAHGEDETRWGLGSYYTRSLINKFSQYSYTNKTAPVIRPVPVGDIMQKIYSDLFSNSVRGQLNADHTWNTKHELNAIAGVEMRETKTKGYGAPKLYGYNDDPLTFQKVDEVNLYSYYNDASYWGTYRIENNQSLSGGISRFTSIYANAAYSYNKRYTLSASARKDAANLFGVNKNRRGKPLWSAGVSWLLSDEPFFKFDFLSYLKLRATYGYQGNVSNNNSAYPVISYNQTLNPVTQLPSASATNPPNPNLGWESVGTLNLAIDFSSKSRRISGSVEYYDKRAHDLLSPSPIPRSNGFFDLSINYANLRSKGIELNLQSSNLKIGSFEWLTNAIFNYNRNKVGHYISPATPEAGSYAGSLFLPYGAFIEGDDAYSLYTYKWAGLDPQTGAPRGYLNGEISKDYNALRSADLNSIENHGSVSPLYFGSIRNTFNWRQFSLSANVLYKFDYAAMKEGISYFGLFQGATGFSSGEYSKRWQAPGDELVTNVPSFRYPLDFNADNFYRYSSANVMRGDHIRLQDINLSYTLNQRLQYLKSLRLFVNMTNVGILWRANKYGIDPDRGQYLPASRTVSFGLNASF